jgi:hypothetical protein
VREQHEWHAGRIEGAIRIELECLASRGPTHNGGTFPTVANLHPSLVTATGTDVCHVHCARV